MNDSLRFTGFPDAKVELLEVANSVLLILPVRSFLFGAEPALEPVFHLLHESIKCLREAEPVVVTHSVDFVLSQGTAKCVRCYSFRENVKDPGDREVFPSSLPG